MSYRCPAAAFAALFTACGSPSEPTKTPSSRPYSGSESTIDTSPPTDSADPTDTAEPTPPDAPYCRSLDPTWADAFTTPVDAALAALIDAHGLLGDPTLYVDADGICRRRSLPTPDTALPQLGRTLFFSTELSGDRDVACATCHHPALGGADAVVLPAGPGFDPHAVGADRVRGITDTADIHGARNTPSVLNVGLWDHRLMWDGRVQAVDPSAGTHGSAGGITTPSGPSTAGDLSTAQALMPIDHPHEMAGSLATGAEDPRTAILARLAEDAFWQAAFATPCAGPDPLPSTWAAACDDPTLPLVTEGHLAVALSTYQRSLVFVDTPWSAYVQGDPSAISDAAKEGALAFFLPSSEGGLHCATCHTGDFFTDEAMHAVGAPQLGPGNPLGTGTEGVDLGRAELTGDSADAYAFRTPTLLNVAHTAPYFHAGSVPTLFRAALHYRDVDESLSQAFHFPGEPFRRAPSWCTTAGFSQVPGCEDLYDRSTTHGGDVSTGVDGELDGIGTARDTSSELVVQFLEALSDPRLDSADALAAWIPEDALPQVTATSAEASEQCRQMVEWPLTQDLRVKGARWWATGALPPGASPHSDFVAHAYFGEAYWSVFGQRFRVRTGIPTRAEVVGVGAFSLMSDAERTALLDAWLTRQWIFRTDALVDARSAIFDRMTTARSTGVVPSTAELSALLEALHTEDIAGSVERAEAYAAAWATGSSTSADALRTFFDGDLGGLGPEVYEPGATAFQMPPALGDMLDDRGIGWDRDLARYVLGYALWTAGPSCTAAFNPRLDFGSQASAHYGFQSWTDGWLFDFATGDQSARPAQIELAGLIEQLEADAGFTGTPEAVETTTHALRAWHDARTQVAEAVRAVGWAIAAGTEVSPHHDALSTARGHLTTAEADLLYAELRYYLALSGALSPAQHAVLNDWIACVESPETQALRGNGGFDAVGGSGCVP